MLLAAHPGSATGTSPQALAACAQLLPLCHSSFHQRTQHPSRLWPYTPVGRLFRLDLSHPSSAPAATEASLAHVVPSAPPALLPQRFSWQMPRATDCANWQDAAQPARPAFRPLSPTGPSAIMPSHMVVNLPRCSTFQCLGMSASSLPTPRRLSSRACSRLTSASSDLQHAPRSLVTLMAGRSCASPTLTKLRPAAMTWTWTTFAVSPS